MLRVISLILTLLVQLCGIALMGLNQMEILRKDKQEDERINNFRSTL